jgi:hypothetical protein
MITTQDKKSLKATEKLFDKVALAQVAHGVLVLQSPEGCTGRCEGRGSRMKCRSHDGDPV